MSARGKVIRGCACISPFRGNGPQYLTLSQIVAHRVRRRRWKGRVSGRVVRRHTALTILGGERRSTQTLLVKRVFIAIRSAHSGLESGLDSRVLTTPVPASGLGTAPVPAGNPDPTRWAAAAQVPGQEGAAEQQDAEGHPHRDREQHTLDLVAARVGLLGRRGKAGGGATATSRTRTTGAVALKTVSPTSSLRAEGSAAAACSVEATPVAAAAAATRMVATTRTLAAATSRVMSAGATPTEAARLALKPEASKASTVPAAVSVSSTKCCETSP
eukprot:scaffold57710_cov62-Phaeocystis_antarctica.AAC.1